MTIQRSVWMVVVAVLALAGGQALAVSATWNGNTDATWANTGNWSASPVPGTGDASTFNGAGNNNTNISLGSGVTIASLYFNTSSAAPYTIGTGGAGSQTLTLNNSGGVLVDASVTQNQRIDANLTLGNAITAQSFSLTNNSTSSTLTFAGAVTHSTTGSAYDQVKLYGGGSTIFSGAIGAALGLIYFDKYGTGTVTLSGTGSASTFIGSISVHQGTLVLATTNTAVGSGTTGGWMVIGDTAGQNSVLKIQAPANITRYDFGVSANATGPGAVYQSGGVLSVQRAANALDLRIGGVASGYGYYSLSGGTLTANEVGIGGAYNGTVGVMDITGGALAVNGYLTIGRGGLAAYGLLNMTGGTVSAVRLELDWAGTSGAMSVLNIGGGSGAAAMSTTASTSLGLSLDNSATVGTVGIANLLANGTLTTGIVQGRNAAPTDVLNFNGGTLKANIANTAFMTSANIDDVFVCANGGTIDNGGYAITVGTPLLAPTSTGVTSVGGPSTKGSGYIGAPMVTLTGGSATVPATAYAEMEDDGLNQGTYRIKDIVVTSPGVYSSVPTGIQLQGGGYGITVASGFTINTAANTSGGMTFKGSASGLTTLSGANTYTGVTTLQSGTMNLGSSGALGGGGNVTFTGGTLQFSASNTSDLASRIKNSTGTISLDSNGQTITFANAIDNSNSGGLTKVGTGTLTLSNTNTFTGVAIVSNGVLALSCPWALSNTVSIAVVSGATCDVSAVTDGYTLGSSQTLKGTGTVKGNLINSGTNSPGFSPGTITINGDYTNAASGTMLIEIAASNSFDQVIVTGNATLGGALTVTNIGDYALLSGSSYTVLTAAAVSGSFATTNLPAVAAGLSCVAVQTPTAVIIMVSGTPTANTYWWDPNQSTAGVGGAGTWNTTDLFWRSPATNNTLTVYPSISGNNDTAVFAGTAGTVTHSGTLYVGSLVLGTDGYTLSGGSFDITGTTGASLVVSNGASGTISSTLAGANMLTKSGAGTVVLSGANTYTGTNTLSEGTVSIAADNNLGASAAAVSLNGGTLKVTAGITDTHAITVGASGGTINVNAGTGQYFLNTANTLLGNGTLTLTGSGSLVANSGNLRVAKANTYGGNLIMQAGGIFEYGIGSAVGASATFTLNGDGELAVNTGMTLPNAITVANGTNNVLSFENGTAGTFSGAITLNTNVTVGLRDWYNNATVRGGTINGMISGVGGMTVISGSGTGGSLTLGTSTNSYAGGTVIANSILINNAGGNTGVTGTVTPFGTGLLTVSSGGQARLGSNPGTHNNTIFIYTNAIAVDGGTLYEDDGIQHLAGSLAVGANGGTLGSTYNNGSPDINKGLYIDGVVSGSGALTVQHSRYNTGNAYNTSFVAFTNNANTYSGTITVNENTATTEGGVYLGVNGSTALSNATVNLVTNIPGGNQKYGSSPLVFNTGLGTAILGGLSGTGTVVLTGYNESTHAYGADSIALTVGGNNSNMAYSGIMSGAGSLAKVGAGTMTLSNTNTFTGATTVSNGVLALTCPWALSNTVSLAVVSGATCDVSAVSGGYTLGAAQTLKGTGRVKGDLTSLGTVSPGFSPGTLTVDGNYTNSASATLLVELASPSSHDKLAISGTAVLGGSLTVSTIDYAPVSGNTYTVITANVISGTFAATNLPALPTGLSWTVTQTAQEIILSVSGTWTPAPSSYWWDQNQTASGIGGAGTWDTIATAWRSPTNDGLLYSYPNTVSSGDAAIFAGVAGTVTHSGAINVNALVFGTNGYTLSGGSFDITGATGASVVASNGASAVISSILTGANSLTKSGAGTVTLSGDNNYNGGTTNSAGTLVLGGTTVLGAGALVMNGGNLDSSVADLVNANNNTQFWNGDFAFVGSQNLNLGTGAATMNASRQVAVNAGTLTLGGGITSTANNSILTITNAGNMVISGMITSGAGASVDLLKSGAGTLTLSGGGGFTNGNINCNLPGPTWGVAVWLRQGTTRITGGTYGVAGQWTIGGVVANGGAGQDVRLLMEGGTLSASDWFSVGAGNGIGGVSSDLIMSNAAAITAPNLAAGYNGGNAANKPKGTITLNNTASLTVSGNGVINLGESVGSDMTMTLNDSAQLIAAGTGVKYLGLYGLGTLNINGSSTVGFGNAITYVGYRSGTGVVSVAGGTFNLAGELRVGGSDQNGSANNAKGTVTIAGGSVNLGALTLARGNNYQNGVSGVVIVNGGTLTCTNGLLVGWSGAGIGRLAIGGGTVNVGPTALSGVMVGCYDTVRGQLDISSGNLNLMNNSPLNLNNDTGACSNVVNQSGGAVTFYSNNGTTVGGTGVLDLQKGGASTSTNIYNLNGGVLLVPTVQSTTVTGMRTFNFNGGTIKAAKDNTSFFNLGSGNARANVRDGGAIIDSNGKSVTLAQALLHSDISGDAVTDGGLTKNGTGTLTLTGVNSYNGGTTINAGSLALSSALTGTTATGALTVNAGGTLSVTVSGTSQLTPSTLTVGIGAGATNEFLGVASTTVAPISTASLILNGALTLNITSGGLLAGHTYPLLAYTSKSGAGSVSLGALPAGVQATLVEEGNAYKLQVTSAPPLLWKGYSSATWDTSTANWTNRNGGAALTFTDNDAVWFDDSASQFSVSAALTVSPGSMTVSNVSQSYTFGGSPIAGTGALTKLGAGILKLTGANTYSGGTIHSAGGLVIGNNDALGTGLLTLGGGTLSNQAASSFTVTNAVNLSAASSIGAASGDVLTFSGNITNSGSLTKIGNGTLVLTGTNNYSGATTVSAGTLQLNGASAMSSLSALTLSSGTLALRSDADAAFTPASIGNMSSCTINVDQINGGNGNHTLSLGGNFWMNGGATLDVESGNGDTLALGTISISAGGSTETISAGNGASVSVAGVTASGVYDTFAFSGAGNIAVAGALQYPGATRWLGLTFNQTGTVTLWGANNLQTSNGGNNSNPAYAPLLYVNSGVTVLNHSSALRVAGGSGIRAYMGAASGSASTTMLLGGSDGLGLTGGITMNPALYYGTIYVRDTTTGTVTIGGQNTSGVNTWGCGFTLGSTANIGKSVTLLAATGGEVDFTGVLAKNGSDTTAGVTIGDATHAGIIKFANANTYPGPTTVNYGVLVVCKNLASSAVTNATGTALLVTNATFSGSLTLQGTASLSMSNGVAGGLVSVAGLALDGGNVLTFDIGATVDSITNTVPGAYVAPSSGVVTINLVGCSGLAAGTYNLITGCGIADTNKFAIGSKTGTGGFVYELASDGANLQLVVDNVPTVWWKGRLGGIWNSTSDGSYNWDLGRSSGIDAETYPGPVCDVYFAADGAANLSTTLGQDFAIKSLSLLTGNVTIAGANILTLSNGITVAAEAGTSTLSPAKVVMSGDQTWSNASVNALTVSCAVTNTAASGVKTLAVAGSGNTAVNGLLGSGPGTVALLKTGGGTLTLSGGSAFSGNSVNSYLPGSSLGPVVFREGITRMMSGTTNAVTGELVIGGVVSDGGAGQNARLVVDNSRLNVSAFLSVGRGNGIGGVSSDIIASNAAAISASDISIGYNGGSTLNKPKGSITLNNTASLAVSGANIYVGESDDSDAFLTLNDSAALSAPAATISVGKNNGTGTLTIKGGSVSAYYLWVGVSLGAGSTCKGTVTVDGGSLASENDIVVGSGGSGAGGAFGTLIITNGGTVNQATTTLRWLKLNRWDTTRGQVDVNGGHLNLNASSCIRCSTENSSSKGTSVINLLSGDITFYSDNHTTVGGTGVLDLQYYGGAGSSATMNLEGGTLTVPQVMSTRTTGARTFNFNGGILKAAVSTTAFLNLGSGNARANVRNGGAVIDTNGKDVTIAQALLHSNIGGDALTDGGLIKNGAGTLTLSGTSSYNGITTVSNGRLEVSGSLVSPVTVAPGAVLTGTGTLNGTVALQTGAAITLTNGMAASPLVVTNGLSLASGSVLNIGIGSSSDKISVTGGSVTPAGTTTVNLTGLGTVPVRATYVLIDGGVSSTTGFVLGSLPDGYQGILSATGGKLQVEVILEIGSVYKYR